MCCQDTSWVCLLLSLYVTAVTVASYVSRSFFPALFVYPVQVGIVTLPAAVVSMAAVPLLLSVLRPKLADQLVGFYDSCLAPWTTDLLGLFYVPVVAILPVLLRGMQGV